MGLNAIVILSHYMGADGRLDSETTARIRLGVEIYWKQKADFIVTSGWNHRRDLDTTIGRAVAEELVSVHGICPDKVLVDTESRDTVGDAFFLRKNIFLPKQIQSITVVTSEYHAARADYIFKCFLTPHIETNTVSVPQSSSVDRKILENEVRSKAAFLRTFEGVDLWNDLEICRTLSRHHPFYNGELHREIDCNDCLSNSV